MNVSWTVAVRPSGAGMETRHFDIRIDMKSNSLGHFTLGGLCWYWIYHANNSGEYIWGNKSLDKEYIMPTFEGIIVD